MSQSIELHGPIHEHDGLAEKLREIKEAVIRKLSGSGVRAEQAAQKPIFESTKAEGDELFRELQELGRISFFSYTRINDILNAALKNPEEMVKVRLNVLKDGLKEGLKKGEPLTEEEWGELATKALESDNVKMWLKAHPAHEN